MRQTSDSAAPGSAVNATEAAVRAAAVSGCQSHQAQFRVSGVMLARSFSFRALQRAHRGAARAGRVRREKPAAGPLAGDRPLIDTDSAQCSAEGGSEDDAAGRTAVQENGWTRTNEPLRSLGD